MVLDFTRTGLGILLIPYQIWWHVVFLRPGKSPSSRHANHATTFFFPQPHFPAWHLLTHLPSSYEPLGDHHNNPALLPAAIVCGHGDIRDIILPYSPTVVCLQFLCEHYLPSSTFLPWRGRKGPHSSHSNLPHDSQTYPNLITQPPFVFVVEQTVTVNDDLNDVEFGVCTLPHPHPYLTGPKTWKKVITWFLCEHLNSLFVPVVGWLVVITQHCCVSTFVILDSLILNVALYWLVG